MFVVYIFYIRQGIFSYGVRKLYGYGSLDTVLGIVVNKKTDSEYFLSFFQTDKTVFLNYYYF